MDSSPNPPSLRERQKAQTHELIVDALVEALAAGELDKMTHDALAKRTGVSRQTVYRHFPDREALLRGLWNRTNSRMLAAPMPTSEAELLAALPTLFQRFDANAELITIAQSTPQGRALRMSVKDKRTRDFLSTTAEAAEGFSGEEHRLIAAVVQLMCGGQAWLEMRQQWDLTGEQMGVAVGWAVRTLLADLHARNGRSLRER
ncbi:MAG TPA: TetR/AcrR family transcriptional regulator [Caulobacteraceae bacterium]|nr:TetR/AcrR family transcriptional regulator [Caulobacteraceae bacterium]